jgi:hypothetical protein
MLAYTYLLPSDNVALNGHFKGSMHALLIPSDNIPSLDGFVVLFYYCTYPVLYGYPGQIDKNMGFFHAYACVTPPLPKKFRPLFFLGQFGCFSVE